MKSMENWKKGRLAISAVCLILGIMLAVQFISVTRYKDSFANQRMEDLVLRLNESESAKQALSEELDELRSGTSDESVQKDQERLKALAGLTPVKGSGLRVILDDSKQAAQGKENPNLYIIHDEDMLKVINELKASGAEAIAINGQRMIAISEVRCVGPTVVVNGVRYSPPYEIIALGDPKTMEAALKLRGGVAETLKFWGVQIQIEQVDELEVPAYSGNFRFTTARPVEQEKSK